MIVVQRTPGEAVRIGPYTLRVLAVHADEVVVGLLDPDTDCADCGERTAERRRCLACGAEAPVCADCGPPRRCLRCASPLT